MWKLLPMCSGHTVQQISALQWRGWVRPTGTPCSSWSTVLWSFLPRQTRLVCCRGTRLWVFLNSSLFFCVVWGRGVWIEEGIWSTFLMSLLCTDCWCGWRRGHCTCDQWPPEGLGGEAVLSLWSAMHYMPRYSGRIFVPPCDTEINGEKCWLNARVEICNS